MKMILIFVFISVVMLKLSVAADIDDDIDDSSINEYHEMGRIQKNVNFITLNVISKVYTTMDSKKIKQYENSTDATSVANGVIIGAGSKVQGDIIIINKSKGDTTAISKKK